MKISSQVTVLYLFLLALFFLNIFLFQFYPGMYEKYFVGEDHGIEWITFFAFLGAGLIGALILRRFTEPGKSKWFFLYFLGVALFYLLCAGEEISWGQRIFGFETFEAIRVHNQQQEFNLHNLDIGWLHPRDIIGAYVYIYGILLPLYLAWRYPAQTAAWRRYLFHPSVAFCFIGAEVLNAMREPVVFYMQDKVNNATLTIISNQIEESVEMYWGLSALAGMIFMYNYWQAYSYRKQNAHGRRSLSINLP